MKQLLVRVLPEFHKELKMASVQLEMSMGELITRAVRAYMKNR